MIKFRLVIFILAIILFIFCTGKSNKSVKEYNLLEGSEVPVKYSKTNKIIKLQGLEIDSTTVNYTFTMYKIKSTTDRNCNGSTIEIVNIKNQKRVKIPTSINCTNFQGIYNNIAIFDDGTGIARGTTLFDLKNGKIIASLGTNGNTKISENKIHMDILDIPKKHLVGKKRPYCGDSIACDGCGEIAEEIYFDCKTHKIIYTGKLKCAYQ